MQAARPRANRLTRWVYWLLCGGLALVMVIGYVLPDRGWETRPGQLAIVFGFFVRTFTFQLSLLACLFAVLALWRRVRLAAGVAGVVAAWGLVPAAASFLRPASASSNAGPGLTVMSFNTQVGFADGERVLGEVRRFDPDVLVVIEYWPKVAASLRAGLAQSHPYVADSMGDDAFGMVVFSKYPIENWAAYPSLGPGLTEPQVRATINVRGEAITLQGVHTRPPVGLRQLRQQVELIDGITRTYEQTQTPVILAGDFNCTRYSRALRRLEDSGFVNTHTSGSGRRDTWPATSVLHHFPGFQIDHVLVKDARPDGWRVVWTQIGDGDTGSDHRPVIVRLTRPGAPAR